MRVRPTVATISDTLDEGGEARPGSACGSPRGVTSLVAMNLRTLGAVAVVLALGSACAQVASTTVTDGGAARDAPVDAAVDAAGPACAVGPLVDLDRDGITTPEGTAAWVDFSRAADAPLVPPIAGCGGEVRLPVMVRWTAPRAGFLRVRVQRDRPDPHSPGTVQALTVRRVPGCAWDAPALGCGLTGFGRDPAFVAEEFEFPVEAGTQWLVFAWTFDFRGIGLERAPIPALRVVAAVRAESRVNAPCTVGAIGLDSSCPAGTDCSESFDGPRCLPRGSFRASCRTTSPRCDAALGCDLVTGRCVSGAGPGDLCPDGACREGSTCECFSCGRVGVCRANGSVDTPCRPDGDMEGPCDAPLICHRRALPVPVCVALTPVGGPCTGRSLCAEGGGCGSNGRCVPLGAEWSSCSASIATGCAVGLRCIHGTCLRLQSRGGDCSNTWCEQPLDCVNGTCASLPPGSCRASPDDCPVDQMCLSGTCRRAYGIGEQPVAGECLNGLRVVDGRCAVEDPWLPCLGDDECLRGTVCRDHVCVVEGHCPTPSPPLPAGHVAGVACGAAARCVESAMGAAVCLPLGRDGGLCRGGAAPACDEGQRCVGGVCVPAPSKSSGVCAAHLACPPGTRCDLGCTAAAPSGEAGGRCRRAADGSGTCDGALRCDLATLTCVR